MYLDSYKEFREKDLKNGLNSRAFLHDMGILTKGGDVKKEFQGLFEKRPAGRQKPAHRS